MDSLDRGDGVALAYQFSAGRSPTLVFLPGFMSDMSGEKASAIAALCAEMGHACLRLDYSGHGASGGRFEDGTIGRWTEDTLCLIDRLTEGPLILVGSSMGGWIALLTAIARPARMAGLIGIAAAPDFTETLVRPSLTPAQHETLTREGSVRVPSDYGAEYVITRRLLEDGACHLILGAPMAIICPVRLLQGQQDPDVPWHTALSIAGWLESEDVRVTMIKDANHRLSRPQDLALLRHAVRGLLGQDGA
jgi:pimeloyl-ACP methyl ester carboxylesterase